MAHGYCLFLCALEIFLLTFSYVTAAEEGAYKV